MISHKPRPEPYTMADVLDGWLEVAPPRPLQTVIDPRVTALAWWLLSTGPLIWRGWIVRGTSECTVELRSIHAPPYCDQPEVRPAELVRVPRSGSERPKEGAP